MLTYLHFLRAVIALTGGSQQGEGNTKTLFELKPALQRCDESALASMLGFVGAKRAAAASFALPISTAASSPLPWALNVSSPAPGEAGQVTALPELPPVL